MFFGQAVDLFAFSFSWPSSQFSRLTLIVLYVVNENNDFRWGGGGGGAGQSGVATIGGSGAYVSAEMYFETPTTLQFEIGSAGGPNTAAGASGYAAGGAGGGTGGNFDGAGGGAATAVLIAGTPLIIAGGGGGAGGSDGPASWASGNGGAGGYEGAPGDRGMTIVIQYEDCVVSLCVREEKDCFGRGSEERVKR